MKIKMKRRTQQRNRQQALNKSNKCAHLTEDDVEVSCSFVHAIHIIIAIKLISQIRLQAKIWMNINGQYTMLFHRLNENNGLNVQNSIYFGENNLKWKTSHRKWAFEFLSCCANFSTVVVVIGCIFKCLKPRRHSNVLAAC